MTTPNEATLAEEAAILKVEEQLGRDDQEEWEYEYSTAETEVQLSPVCTLAIQPADRW